MSVKAIVFDGNTTKFSPEAFPGVQLQSYIHPDPQWHDGYDANIHGAPDVRFSFGIFTIAPHHSWPITKFSIAEVIYVLSGTARLTAGDESFDLKEGQVVYLPKNLPRSIENTSDVPFRFLDMVDPAWQPEFEVAL
ncbi:MAG: cupin domain-containing protein [Holosporales bacterium]